MPGRALRRRAGRRPARGRPGGRVRRATSCRRPAPAPSSPVPVAISPRPPGAVVRPARPAPPGRRRAVGLREGGRGLRPRLRLLRHPDFRGPSGAAARARLLAEVDELEAPGDRPRRPGPGLLRARPGDEAGATWSRSSRPVARARVDWVRLLYLYPSELHRRSIDAVLATGVPYFDLSLQHVSRPAAAPDAALGRRRPLPRADRRRIRADAARRRLPVELHRRLSRRDRGRPRPAARLRRRGPARLVRVLRLLPRSRAPTPTGSTARCRPASWRSAWPSCAERQDAITAAKRDDLIGSHGPSARGRTGDGQAIARPPRSTASSRCPTTSRPARSPTVVVTGAARARPGGRAGRWPRLRRERGRAGTVVSDAQTFGPSALATPANAVTVVRLLVIAAAVQLIIEPALVVGRVRALDRPRLHRRRRRLDRPPPRHHPLGRLPRPAGRQGAGARRAVRAGVDRPVRRGCRSPSSPSGRWPSACTGSTGVAGGWPCRREAAASSRRCCRIWPSVPRCMPPLAWRTSGSGNALLWVSVVVAVVSGLQYLVAGRARRRPWRRPPASAPTRVRRPTSPADAMRCEVVAVGTELLLGQIVDTNSAWIGEQLALAGIDSYFQVKVGDNPDRIAEASAHRPRPQRRRASCAAASGPPRTTSPAT